MSVKSSKWLYNISIFSTLGPPKFPQFGNFGLKINHLATLLSMADLDIDAILY
jgi:hypothetical protein